MSFLIIAFNADQRHGQIKELVALAHIRVFNHYIQSPYVVLAAIEFTILAACAYLSIVLTQPAVILEAAQFGLVIRFTLIYASVMLLSTFSMGVYETGVKENFAAMAVRSVVSFCLVGGILMLLLGYILFSVSVMKGALFTAVALSLASVLAVRYAFYSVVDAVRLRRRILVLGAGKKAAQMIESIRAEASVGFDIVGFIPSDGNSIEVPEHQLLDPVGGIGHLVSKHNVDEIVVALDDRRRDSGGYFPLDELLDWKLNGIRITPLVGFYERELGRIELAEIHPGWMVFGDGFRYSRSRDGGKRVFDIGISLVLLALVWPLMLMTMLAVFLETGRPVLYKQQRVGFNGRVFEIVKFRSMTQNAEQDGKAVWAQQNDARVTRIGAFIRNTRLDELPQIFNVLKGEMSFVGPRPERPEFVGDLAKQLPYYEARHRVKPGLMGWAQLKYPYGASVEDAANKLVYDLYYVKNHSVLLDVLIVVQSVEVILLGKGVR